MAVTKQTLTDDSNPNPYTVRNPHPGHGIDPNIKNEFGHTEYPKWVDHPTKKEVVQIRQTVGQSQVVTHNVKNDHPERVKVQDETEERKLYDGKLEDEFFSKDDKKVDKKESSW